MSTIFPQNQTPGGQLQGIAGMSDTTRAFVQTVRLYMRDFAELNRLVKGEETSDRMIAWATLDALSRFNGTPFLTQFSLEDLFLQQQQWLLTRMTMESIVESVTMLQMRNHLNYSNGGINVGVNDKAPMLMNWLQLHRSVTEQKLVKVKVAMNINQILGPSNSGVHSEYWSINSSYLSY